MRISVCSINRKKMIQSLSLALTTILFAGCASQQNERSKVGGMCRSCNPYFVRGSWHYPQKHYEYSEEGLASWYGPGFHNKKKASTERFDQHSMNAAHKTLPLPTIVRVTNLENGKQIDVLVDDRGPFVYDGRIIDLSMAAAKAIGSYQKGIAKVRVEALIDESRALSDYLAKHHIGKDKLKRTWNDIYQQEIKGRMTTPTVQDDAPPRVTKIKRTQHAQKAADKNTEMPATELKKTQTAAETSKPFYVNIKREFTSKEKAEAFAARANKHFPTTVLKSEDGAKNNSSGNHKTKGKKGKSPATWKVHAGPFTDKSKIPAVKEKLSMID